VEPSADLDEIEKKNILAPAGDRIPVVKPEPLIPVMLGDL
jgi:hypothetical protein